MLKYVTLSIALVLSLIVRSQCIIDSSIVSWGFHPDTGTVLKHGCQGSQYDAVIQIFAPESVTVAFGTFPVNYVQLDSMRGLPADMFYSTNPLSGYMAGGERGCINIYGTASAPVGLYEFTIYYTANFTFLGAPNSLNFTAPYKIQIDSGTATFGDYSDSICAGEQYLFNNQWITAGGDYSDTLTNQAGCDSIVTLHLTVQQTPGTQVITSNDTIRAPVGYQNYTLIDCNNGSVVSSGTLNEFIAPGLCCFAVIMKNNNCADTSECFSFETGLYKMQEGYFSIYPTITNGLLNVSTSYGPHKLTIYSTDGQVVIQKDIFNTANVLDASHLLSGTYIAELSNGQQRLRKKFILLNE
ncbi:MAG TPA: T9SS type A sorting domain-containing protein [Chitinophagales bacterium]|nr:T9SS type A sorting domain-containing protein [Chitinophagales bacterium]